MSSILKNLRRKKNNKKGFTLMELLGVVAIIVILLSLSGIFIFSYLRTLYQLKLDNIAKEIFISAQNHLSMIDGENYLGGFDESYFGTAELDENGKSTGVYYFVVNKDTLDKYSDDTLLASLLPYASIDDDIRSDNSFVIRYHKDQAIILDVFYAEPDGKYPHGFTKDEYSDLIENYRGDDKKKDRRKYSETNAVIGYYGGVDEDLMNRVNRFVAPKITIYNEEKLIVEIDNTDNSQTNGSLRLLITGKTSGKSKYIDIVKDGQMVSGNAAISQVGSNQVFRVVLDDITSASLGFNAQFASSGLIPGENIIVRAIAYTNNAYTNIASSGKSTTNSLYASYDEDNKSCEVSNIRHIENLSKIISNVSVEVDKATQISDITWGESSSIFNKNNSIYEANGTSKLVEGSYVPVEVTSDSFIYDGNNNHSITGIYVNTNTNNSKVNLLNGGLFSKLDNGEVKNLRLVNFDIDSYNGYAGALVGNATNLKINGVLAYNSYKDDSSLSIEGNKNAGGLVGNMSGGKISASAAAVYVKSNSGAAGGLVGSMSNSGEVIDSYAGGHTNDGRYTNNTAGKGRYNVIGSTNAGGLIGELSRSSVSYSYSTASAKANNAGGLIGRANASNIDNVYCTGRVSGTTNTDNFVAISENTCTYTGARYYLSSINENISNITNATAVNASDQSGKLIIVSDKTKRLAYVHDVALEKTTTLYPFKTISQWHSGAASTSITNYHYGDWQVPTLKSANFTFYNDDTLRLVIDVDKKESELTFALSGDVSNKTKIFQLRIEGTSVSIVKEGEVDADGNSTWLDSVTTKLPISYDSSNRKITIVLDNITTNTINNTNGVTIANSNKSFYQIFGNYYIIGENISVRVANKYNEWVEIVDVEAQTQNTSFAKHDEGDIGNAKIAYLRHLQNLDPIVSNVDDQIKTAKQLDNIAWSDFYNSIHNYDGSKNISNTFYGIRNKNLTKYDGNYKELSNFVINSNAYKSFGGDYSSDAGLFRYVDSEMTLTSLKIKDFTVSSTDGNAAVAIGEIGGNNLINIEDVLVTNESMNQKVTVTRSDNDTTVSAGGLVGRANAPLTIENSSASIQINSDGYAGGLVGVHDTSGGTLIIKEAFAGGHTLNAEYLVDNPNDYNIVSNDGTAGGLVGYADGSTINIEKSFSTASVSAKNGVAGGIIGAVNEQANLDYVYVIAPVYDVKVNSKQDTTANGAFIGQIVSSDNAKVNNTNTYYLPEIYEDNETSSSSTAVEYVGVGCADKMNPVYLAYYTKDGKNNVISSKISTDTLTVKTFVYDDKLDEDDKEYPFSIWTAFAFKENNNISNISLREYGTFYGDWQPLLNTALKTITATFYYQDPITKEVIQSSDTNLAVQQVVSNKDQSVLLPQVESFAGYKIGTWTVYSKDGTKLAELVGSQGFITLSKEYITADLDIVANYISKGESSVIFMYDPSGKNENYEKISGVEVKTNSYLKDVKPVPSREIDNYEFVGWFTEPNGQGEELKFDSESTQTVDKNIVTYAQYKEIKYYSITVDFMYAIGKEEAEYLINVPRYRVKDKAQYQIKVIEGETFDNQIDIKDVTEKINAQVGADNVKSVSVGKYNDEGLVEESTEIQLDDKKTKVKVTTDKESHYVVTYYVVDTHSGEYIYNIKLKLKDTKTDTNEENMLNASQYEKDSICTFVYDSSYGQIVGGVPQIPDIDLGMFEFAGFKRLTEKADISLIPVEGKDDEYDIIIEYERKKYTLVFDSTSGTYIEPVELTFGQSLSDGKPSIDPTRTGYTFAGWSLVSRVASDSLAWTDRMPASQVNATAQWTPADTTYKVIYWKQKVTDDRSLNLNGLDDQKTYDYAAMETKTAKTGTTVDGTFANSYSGTKTIGGKQVKLDGFKYLRSDSATVAGDGSTVINVYFDRRIIRIHFSKSRTGDIDNLDGTNNYVLSTDEDAIYALIDGEYETLIKKTEDGVTKYYRKVVDTSKTYEFDDAYIQIGNISEYYYYSGNWYLYENGDISSRYLYYRRGGWDSNSGWYKTRTENGRNNYKYEDEVDASNIYIKASDYDYIRWYSGAYYQFKDGVRYEATKQSDGKYVYAEYTYKYVEWTGDRYSAKYPFVGLFEQSFSMYGYSWPQGKYTLGYYYGDSNTGIVFLGAFIAPDTDEYNTEDIYIYRDSTNTSVNFYFCLQNLDGEYEDGEWDIGYSTSGGTFNFSNKYEGFEVAQYTYNFSTNPSNWNNTYNGGSVRISQNKLYVGYERKTYSLDYVSVISGVLKDSYDTNGDNIESQSVKFEDSLVNHKVTDIALTRDENGMTYTWDGKYYSDQACTKEFDFDSKMPSSNVAVYLRYVLREYTINFNINDPNVNENPATYIDAANHQSSIVKEEGQTIDSIIANNDGSLKDAYKAVKTGYVFDDSYWYYLDENGSETIKIYNSDGTYTEKKASKFINSQQLHGDTLTIDLYCRWYEEGEIEQVEVRNVTIKYILKSDEEEKTILADDTIEKDKYVNSNIIVKAKEIEGYYPEYTMQRYRVTESDNQVVYFEYIAIEAWNYDVEYYVRYRSYEEALDSDALGISIESTDKVDTYLLSKQTDNKAYEQYAVIEFKTISGYENYHLVEYDFIYKNGDTEEVVQHGTGSTVTITPSYEDNEKVVIRYYLEPDVSKVSVNNIYTVYDGTDKRIANSEDKNNIYSVPNDMTSTTTDIYKYYDDEGNVLSEAVDAGAYITKGYVVLTVNDNTDSDNVITKNYLLYKTPDNSMSLVIGKRYIDISSADLSVKYDEQPHKKLEYTVSGEVDGETVIGTGSGEEVVYNSAPFVSGEGVTIYSSADASRLEPGTSENGFTYELLDGTNADNYVITTNFGKIKITWDYRIKVYAEYESIVDTTFNELWSGDVLSTEVVDYLISESEKTNIAKKTVTIEESAIVPAEYSSYKLSRVVYNGNTIDSLPYDISPYKVDDSNYGGVLEVYLTLDTDEIIFNDIEELKHDAPEVVSINIKQLPAKVNGYVEGDTYAMEGLIVEAKLDGGEVITLNSSQYSLSIIDGETTTSIKDGDAIAINEGETSKTITITYITSNETVDGSENEAPKITTSFNIGIGENEATNNVTPLVEEIIPTTIKYADDTTLAIKESYELSKIVVPYTKTVNPDDADEYIYSYLPRTKLASISENDETYPIDLYEVIKIVGQTTTDEEASTRYFLIKVDTSKQKSIKIIEQTTN